MKALAWHGTKDVRVDNVPDPQILNPHDAIIEIKASAICGSDLHLYNGWVLTMKKGDVLGHEFAGEVVEVGSAVNRIKKGDRIVVPFTIACGSCPACKNDLWSLCDNTNPNATMQSKIHGYPSSGLFGYSHLYGGYQGGQAQYVRVPFVDVGGFNIPEEFSYEQTLFLSDIFPTGYMAAENCNIKPGDTIAVWGCGPVGQMAIASAYLLGAKQVIAIDRFADRLEMARDKAGATTIDYLQVDVLDSLKELTGGRGPNAVIDAVGMEAHGTTIDAAYDEVMMKARIETDRSHALREAIMACGKGGTVSIPGVYVGFLDRFPLGIAFAKGLTLKMGQTHVHKYLPRLLEHIRRGEIDPTFVISHRINLEEVPEAYETFDRKEDGAIKYVIRPS